MKCQGCNIQLNSIYNQYSIKSLSTSYYNILRRITTTTIIKQHQYDIHNNNTTIQQTQPIVTTRFAPSPTGQLHIGSLRTALYNYLYAKHSNGNYILRIEDTDTKRYVENADIQLIDILKQCNIIHDNNDNVIYQSKRLHIYHKYIDELLASNAVYPCFCDENRLNELKLQQAKQGIQPQYDRLCANLSFNESQSKLQQYRQNNESYVIRLRVPQHTTKPNIVIRDMIRGM